MGKYKYHFCLILAFCLIFIITQKLDTKTLLLGLICENNSQIKTNYKTDIQGVIFVEIMAFSFSLLMFSKKLIEYMPKLWERLITNICSILIIYFINYYLSKIFITSGFCMYYNWKDNLGPLFAIETIIVSLIMFPILEYVLEFVKLVKK